MCGTRTGLRSKTSKMWSQKISLLVLVAQIYHSSCNEKYSGIYSTFPMYRELPQKLDDALTGGYVKDKACSSTTDQYGAVYSQPGARYLPGLIYNTHGQLSGMVFGVNKSELMNPDEAFAPFSHGEVRGQVHWFREPSSICDPQSPKTDSVAHGIWIRLPDGNPYQIPEKPEFPTTGYKTASHWTEHLCLVGMGTHLQYGECSSQYLFTVLYDAKDDLVGIVNAVNIKTAMADAPELIETLKVSELTGLVFNESRFDPCFILDQPRIFIHTVLKKPEVEYQSCDPPTEFTPANNPVKRCVLCEKVLKSVLGSTCAGEAPSSECCCEMSRLYNQTGSCSDQGCKLSSGCDKYVLAECSSGTTPVPVVMYIWGLMAMSLLFLWY